MTELRPLRRTDAVILAEATLTNLNWAADRFTLEDVRAEPHFAHYARCVEERGDFGFVAESGGEWIGVVWVLFLPEDDPGYGFVSSGTPELSVCVRARWRRRGIGRALLRRAIDEASRRGPAAVSLSVQEGNGARVLYASLGFVDDPGEGLPGTMIATL